MRKARSKIGVVFCLFLLVACAGCDEDSSTASAETSAEAADDSSEEPSASSGEADRENGETEAFDGTDIEAFDASWQQLSEGLSQEERLQFDLAVFAAVVRELEPEGRRGEIDVESMLEALDGKTPDEIKALAEKQLGEDLDLDQLTEEEVQEISEEVGFDVTGKFLLADIVDAAEAQFGTAEETSDSESAGPYRRTAGLVMRLNQAVEMYYVTHEELPESLDDLTRGDSPLLEEVPQDPWGNDFIYEVEGDTDFAIISKGADGERGTNEDLVFDK